MLIMPQPRLKSMSRENADRHVMAATECRPSPCGPPTGSWTTFISWRGAGFARGQWDVTGNRASLAIGERIVAEAAGMAG